MHPGTCFPEVAFARKSDLGETRRPPLRIHEKMDHRVAVGALFRKSPANTRLLDEVYDLILSDIEWQPAQHESRGKWSAATFGVTAF